MTTTPSSAWGPAVKVEGGRKGKKFTKRSTSSHPGNIKRGSKSRHKGRHHKRTGR
jgi:hypothetical protein